MKHRTKNYGEHCSNMQVFDCFVADARLWQQFDILQTLQVPVALPSSHGLCLYDPTTQLNEVVIILLRKYVCRPEEYSVVSRIQAFSIHHEK